MLLNTLKRIRNALGHWRFRRTFRPVNEPKKVSVGKVNPETAEGRTVIEQTILRFEQHYAKAKAEGRMLEMWMIRRDIRRLQRLLRPPSKKL